MADERLNGLALLYGTLDYDAVTDEFGKSNCHSSVSRPRLERFWKQGQLTFRLN